MSDNKAVLFPFTYISPEIARAIYRRLGCLVVYQPVSGQTPPEMNRLSEEGIIEIRYPVLGGEDRLMDTCRAYRRWGDIHQGNTAALKQGMQSWSASEMRPSAIRSEILSGARGEQEQRDDPLSAARLFLQMAQIYDMQQAELFMDLESSDRSEALLFEELTGGDAGDIFPAAKRLVPDRNTDDTGLYLADARMTAWGALARNDTQKPAVYVTHSRAVVDFVADRLGEDCCSLPANGRLQTEAADASGPEDGYRLEQYFFPDVSHAAVSDIFPAPESYPDNDKSISNQIVIVLLVRRV